MSEGTQILKEVKLKYILTFGNNISNPTKSLPELKLVEGVSISIQDNNNATYNLVFNGIKINKKIYQPCEIEAEFDFTMTQADKDGKPLITVPTFEEVSNLLLQRQVKVEVIEVPAGASIEDTLTSREPITVAKNCYVFEVNPQLKRDSRGTKMFVKTNIFSMDKLMTLNKYSKAYVARKLGSGILKPESLAFCQKDSDGNPLIKTNIKGMKFLKYDEQFVVKGDDGKKVVTTIPSEFIQPYLVQYNESFYDFLVRTSNRCGEFLFFEDGELTLGLPDNAAPVVIDDFDTVTAQSVTSAPLDIQLFARDSAKEGKGELKGMNWSPIGKDSSGYPKKAFAEHPSYNSEVSTDEYIFPLYKDKATTLAREMMYDDPKHSTILKALTIVKNMASSNKKDFKKMMIDSAIVKFGPTESIKTFFSNLEADKVNEKLEKNFFNPLKKYNEQCDGDKVVEFGTLAEEGWTSLDYYNDVLKHEEEQQKKIICIDMSTKFYPLHLGQKIKIAGTDNTYVIIQILMSSEEGWKNDYSTYGNHHSDLSESQRSMKIYAIPAYKKDENDKDLSYIPPVQPVPITRKSGPQTAFIVKSNDPKFQGRVRIAYPWQSLGDQVQARLEAAEISLHEATEQKTHYENEAIRLGDELTLIVNDLNEMKDWLTKSEADRIAIKEGLQSDIVKNENDIAGWKSEIEAATQAVKDKEQEISNLPADMENREMKLRELEEDKEVLIVRRQQKIDENEPKIAEAEKKKSHNEAHLKELNAVEDKSKRDSEIRKKEQALNDVKEEKKKAENQKKAAEADVNAKTSDRDRAKKDKDKKLQSIASPWIRVATPIATEGGGFYYEPREGDEVLVNFDNDNIERPYVVGQLYSKNTLDPRERMNRKQSIKKLGSMALVSPNGHHIAFSDPGDGGGIIGSLIPGIGVVNKIQGWIGPDIPYLSRYALKPKELKDLTGGIHIGDRYGLYEISMSSDGRKININSPLGQVNLNAFTGISISAPNGDIKIEGKNIEIKAGNKITVESGTNIGLGPEMGKVPYKDGLTKYLHYFGHEVLVKALPEAGKQVYNEFPITDLSFMRYMAQTFLRPVDGTMLIKSHKYMLLEAGKGKAYVKDNRYKTHKPDDYFKVYKTIYFCIGQLQVQLQEFFKKYAELWKTATDSRWTYAPKATAALKDPAALEIRALILANINFNNALDPQLTSIINAFTDDKFVDGYSADKKKELKDEAIEVTKQIYNLVKHVGSIGELFKNVKDIISPPAAAAVVGGGAGNPVPPNPVAAAGAGGNPAQDYVKWVLEDLVGTLGDMEPELKKSWSKTYVFKSTTGVRTPKDKFLFENTPEDLLFTDRTPIIREFAARFILRVSGNAENANRKYIYVAYDKKDIYRYSREKLKEDFYWKRFINDMDKYIQNSVAWREFLMSWADKYWFDRMDKTKWTRKYTDVWDKNIHGQILFSDDENHTLNLIKDGVSTEEEANQFNLDKLKLKLFDVKYNP